MVHPRPGVLLRVVDEVRERQQRDPVIGAVVRQPRADLVLEDDLGADERAVEVDHLLKAGCLEVDVVERWVDHGGVGHARAPEVVGVEVMFSWVRRSSSRAGTASGGGGAAEHVEVGADEHGVRVVLGQPRGEAPVAVADTVRRSRVKRGDRRLKGVEQRALPVGEMFERVAVGDDQLKATADDVVEASLAAARARPSLDAQGPGKWIGFTDGLVEQAGGQRRELERRRRPGGAQRRVALGGRLRVELAEDLAELDRQPDHASFCGCRSASIGVQQPLGRDAAQHEVELPGEVCGVAQPGAQSLTEERRRQVGGVADQQHAPLAHPVSEHRAELVDGAASQRPVRWPVPRLEQRPHAIGLLEISRQLVRAAA